MKEAKEKNLSKKDFVSYCKEVLPTLDSPFSTEEAKAHDKKSKSEMEKVAVLLFPLFEDFETKKNDPLESVIEFVVKCCQIPKTFTTIQRVLGGIKFKE